MPRTQNQWNSRDFYSVHVSLIIFTYELPYAITGFNMFKGETRLKSSLVFQNTRQSSVLGLQKVLHRMSL